MLISLQGYLFISVLISGNSELIQLIIQSIKNDLASRNPVHVSLALQCIANIGSKDMAEAFGQEIPKLLVSGYVQYQQRLWDSLSNKHDFQGHFGCCQAVCSSVPTQIVQN